MQVKKQQLEPDMEQQTGGNLGKRDGEGQGSLACHSPYGCKELNAAEKLNNNNSSHECNPLS